MRSWSGNSGTGSDSSERVVLFLQLKDSAKGTGMRVPKELEAAMKERIATELSRRHVPSFFFAVESVPYNVNGKKLEIPLRAVISEGASAFGRRKFTKEEREWLEKFLGFYEVEKMVGEAGEESVKAKL